MEITSHSLLERLRQPENSGSWERFTGLYTPILFVWAQRLGLQEPDAADLIQEVFMTVLEKLPEFHSKRVGSFRKWLHTVMINLRRAQLRKRKLAVAADAAVADVAEPEQVDILEETEYRRHLANRALHLMQSEFSRKTWQACWEHVVNDRCRVTRLVPIRKS